MANNLLCVTIGHELSMYKLCLRRFTFHSKKYFSEKKTTKQKNLSANLELYREQIDQPQFWMLQAFAETNESLNFYFLNSNIAIESQSL